MKCLKCDATEKSGRIFFVCDKCSAQFCNKCASKGNQCTKCRRGFLK